jgi:ATP-dependent RNA helicase RhlE
LTQLFTDLGLTPALARAVGEEGYTQPTGVQLQAIPPILAGRDVLAGAQTGTGKTAAFALPVLQRLAASQSAEAAQGRHAIRALVVTPTRELAAQVEESFRTYGKYVALRSTVIFGGVGINPQIDAVRRGVDILVATPGRLLDHVQQKTVDLSHVEILILDEADRMLDMGFIPDVRRILALLPKKRQNLLFSATFNDEIRKLAQGLLHDPALIEVARRNSESELVAQRVYAVGQTSKRDLLAHLVSSGDWKQVLVFTRTKHGANRLSEQLSRKGIESSAIHGNKSQSARTKALAGFKEGNVRVLVATDIAARGLDIEELPHVVNYDLPHVAEDYVHRIGRTGRAGSTGEAITLVAPEEMGLLNAIEKLLGRRLERETLPGFPSTPASESQQDNGRRDRQQPGRGSNPRRDRQSQPRSGERTSNSRGGGGRRNERQPNAPMRQNPHGSPQHASSPDGEEVNGNREYPQQAPSGARQRQDRGGRPQQQRGNPNGGGRDGNRRDDRRGPASGMRQRPDGDQQPHYAGPAAEDADGNREERQPASSATQAFPSSGKVYGNSSASTPSRTRSFGGARRSPRAPVLGGGRRSGS